MQEDIRLEEVHDDEGDDNKAKGPSSRNIEGENEPSEIQSDISPLTSKFANGGFSTSTPGDPKTESQLRRRHTPFFQSTIETYTEEQDEPEVDNLLDMESYEKLLHDTVSQHL